MRYSQQAYEIRVPLQADEGELGNEVVEAAVHDFHEAHNDQYGYAYEGKEPTELVNIGVTGFGLLRRPALQRHLDGETTSWDGALKYVREMYDGVTKAMIDCPVYDRAAAPSGVALAGPAIVEQYDATLAVGSGWTVTANDYGHLIVTR